MIFGWDSSDALYDRSAFTGWHTGYPDAPASGLYGVEGRIAPPPPLSGDAYAAPAEVVRPLPGSLEEATEAFRTSRAARDLFGDAFVDHFAMTREWEVRQFRKAVTDWGLQRYFEII